MLKMPINRRWPKLGDHVVGLCSLQFGHTLELGLSIFSQIRQGFIFDIRLLSLVGSFYKLTPLATRLRRSAFNLFIQGVLNPPRKAFTFLRCCALIRDKLFFFYPYRWQHRVCNNFCCRADWATSFLFRCVHEWILHHFKSIYY